MTAKHPAPPELERVPARVAEKLLARASELDANSSQVAELRKAATEAGISPAAFDAALAEYRTESNAVAAPAVRAPRPSRLKLWLALGAFAAMAFFTVMMMVIPNAAQVAATDSAEFRFTLKCIPTNAALTVIRSNSNGRTTQVTARDGVIQVRSTLADMPRIQDALGKADGVCALPGAANPGSPVPTPPPATGR